MVNQTAQKADVEHESGHRAETKGISTMEGEFVLQNRHPGWGLWWKALGIAAFFVLATFPSGEAGTIIGGLLIAGIIVGYVAYVRSISRYIVTDERIKMDIGLFRSISREYRISDVQGLDTTQGILARLFGIGTIEVRTADGTSIPWRGVPNHEDVAHEIRQHQRRYDETMDRK